MFSELIRPIFKEYAISIKKWYVRQINYYNITIITYYKICRVHKVSMYSPYIVYILIIVFKL